MTNSRTELEAPKKDSNYFYIKKDEEQKIRIIGNPIMGRKDEKLEGDQKKDVYTKNRQPDLGQVITDYGKVKAELFWATAVYNINEKRIQIWIFIQKAIKNKILELRDDSDRGSDFDYDLKTKKTGKGKDTLYTILPSGKSPLNDEAKKTIEDTPYNLDLLFSGKDPIRDYEPIF